MTSDPDIPVIFVAGFGLLLFAVISIVVLFAAIAAIKHKRWGWLLAGGAFSVLGLMTVAGVLFGYASAERAALDPPPRPQATTAKAQLVSDAELIGVAAAEPKIQLKDQATEATDAEEAAEGETLALQPPTEPRPEWMTAELEEGQQRFTAGPFTTVEQCRTDARLQLTDWVWEITRTRQPDFGADPPADWSATLSEIAKRFSTEEHLEKRQTSVGEVYLLHTLAEIDKENYAWLNDRVERWVRESRQTRGVRTVAVGGGLALGLLGLGHAILRAGGKEDEAPKAHA